MAAKRPVPERGGTNQGRYNSGHVLRSALPLPLI